MSDSPLRRALSRIDGRPYPAYRDLRGTWDIPEGQLVVDHVQGDPFAAPSHIRVRVPSSLATTLSRNDRVAAEDWLLRQFADALSGSRRGSGRSGELSVYRPGPDVCPRSALHLHEDHIEVRLRAGLPAKGRRILARQAVAMLEDDLPRALRALHTRDGLAEHCQSVAVQRELREGLGPAGLVAFVANGSVLPRASGVDTRPLHNAVPFTSPPSLERTLETSQGPVTGMGIACGVTLIVGGGFHGKSTLLDALGRGHLDHIPGDGRERVVTVPSVMPVRAEDGRSVRGVDISAFLGTLPNHQDTRHFTTDDASGSTSQAAALIEALEGSSRCVLIDEDRSATNWLVRDARMAQLVPDDHEPITPLVRRIRSLWEDHGTSTVLVCGGVSAFLDVADTVIGMHEYTALDLTHDAKALAQPRHSEPMAIPLSRVVVGGLEADRVRARDQRTVQFDRVDLDLAGVGCIRDTAHARSLALALRFCGNELVDGERTVPHMVSALMAILRDEGLDVLSDRVRGDVVHVRAAEVVAALSRLRSVRVQDPV